MKQRRIALYSWTIVICLLTLLPGNCFPQIRTFWDWLQWDKLVHLFMFGIFSILFLRVLTFSNASIGKYISAFAAGGAFGGVIELLQFHLIRGRSGNYFDFYADLAGCLLCLIFYAIWEKRGSSLKKTEKSSTINQ